MNGKMTDKQAEVLANMTMTFIEDITHYAIAENLHVFAVLDATLNSMRDVVADIKGDFLVEHLFKS